MLCQCTLLYTDKVYQILLSQLFDIEINKIYSFNLHEFVPYKRLYQTFDLKLCLELNSYIMLHLFLLNFFRSKTIFRVWIDFSTYLPTKLQLLEPIASKNQKVNQKRPTILKEKSTWSIPIHIQVMKK